MSIAADSLICTNGRWRRMRNDGDEWLDGEMWKRWCREVVEEEVLAGNVDFHCV